MAESFLVGCNPAFVS